MEELNFGTDNLKEVFEQSTNFAKFEIGKAYKVEVMSPKIVPREANFDGKISMRYDITVKVDGSEEKVWSVSKTVLRTISDNWDKTKVFNVMRAEKSYNVIPLA